MRAHRIASHRIASHRIAHTELELMVECKGQRQDAGVVRHQDEALIVCQRCCWIDQISYANSASSVDGANTHTRALANIEQGLERTVVTMMRSSLVPDGSEQEEGHPERVGDGLGVELAIEHHHVVVLDGDEETQHERHERQQQVLEHDRWILQRRIWRTCRRFLTVHRSAVVAAADDDDEGAGSGRSEPDHDTTRLRAASSRGRASEWKTRVLPLALVQAEEMKMRLAAPDPSE